MSKAERCVHYLNVPSSRSELVLNCFTHGKDGYQGSWISHPRLTHATKSLTLDDVISTLDDPIPRFIFVPYTLRPTSPGTEIPNSWGWMPTPCPTAARNVAQATCRKTACRPASEARPDRVLRFCLYLGFKMSSLQFGHITSPLCM